MSVDLNYRKDWNNSLRNSIVMHVLLLLLAFFLRMESDPKNDIDTQYAVTVSFEEVEFRNSKSSNSTKSAASQGAQRAKSEAPKLESPKPAQIPVPTPTPSRPKPTPSPPVESPQPTEPVISETTTDESEIQAIEEPIEVSEPEPEYIPQENTDPTPVDEPVILFPDLPSLDDIIGDINDDPIESEEAGIPADKTGNGDSDSKTSGSGTSDPSLKDGDGGSGKGNTGTGKGNDADGNDNDSGKGTGNHGEGEYDDSGDGIFGRKVIYQDPSMIAIATGSVGSGSSGKLVFKVCINRRGTISHLEINDVLTTIKDGDILRKALAAMQKYKFEPDVTASTQQCGQYSVVVDRSKGIR